MSLQSTRITAQHENKNKILEINNEKQGFFFSLNIHQTTRKRRRKRRRSSSNRKQQHNEKMKTHSLMLGSSAKGRHMY